MSKPLMFSGRENEGGAPSAAPLVSHPASLIFPAMTTKEFADLCEDIKARGLEDPIVLSDGQILEGNHRYRACCEMGVAPRFIEWTGDDPVAFVVSKNLHRRHLTSGQKAAVAVEIEEQYKATAQARQAHGQTAPGRTLSANLHQASGKALDHAAKAVGVSARSAGYAKAIKKESPEAFKELKNGTSSVNAALKKAGKNGRDTSHVAKTKAKQSAAIAEDVAARARIRASDAETKYQSMLNAPEGKLNLPLLDRATKIQDLLVEVCAITPEKAVSGIPALRCREYSLEMAQWWLRFAELCEERRQRETPDLPTVHRRPRLAAINPVAQGREHVPVAERHLPPVAKAALDWLRSQPEPVTAVEIAVAIRSRESSVRGALSQLCASDLAEIAGTLDRKNLYRTVPQE